MCVCVGSQNIAILTLCEPHNNDSTCLWFIGELGQTELPRQAPDPLPNSLISVITSVAAHTTESVVVLLPSVQVRAHFSAIAPGPCPALSGLCAVGEDCLVHSTSLPFNGTEPPSGWCVRQWQKTVPSNYKASIRLGYETYIHPVDSWPLTAEIHHSLITLFFLFNCCFFLFCDVPGSNMPVNLSKLCFSQAESLFFHLFRITLCLNSTRVSLWKLQTWYRSLLRWGSCICLWFCLTVFGLVSPG